MPDVPGVTAGQLVLESWGDLVAAEVNALRPYAILNARGQIIRRGATAPQALALGASSAVLTSDGTDVVWSAARSGTAFPSSPAAGDHFLRTDQNIWYLYGMGGGSTWLSVQELSLGMSPGIQGATVGSLGTAIGIERKIQIMGGNADTLVFTPNDTTHFWRWVFYAHSAAGSSAFAELSTYGVAAGTYWNLALVGSGGIVDPASGYRSVWSAIEKFGAPGALYMIGASMRYRYVG